MLKRVAPPQAPSRRDEVVFHYLDERRDAIRCGQGRWSKSIQQLEKRLMITTRPP